MDIAITLVLELFCMVFTMVSHHVFLLQAYLIILTAAPSAKWSMSCDYRLLPVSSLVIQEASVTSRPVAKSCLVLQSTFTSPFCHLSATYSLN